jgi:pyridoxal phosphate enzyme (YggS family)
MMDVRPTAGRLDAVRRRIAAACERAGRAADDVLLVVVTKQVPLPLVVEACRAGAQDLGENRVFDALVRQDQLLALLSGAGVEPTGVRWHFIGHLQRNKASRVAGKFALLHGVDSAELAVLLSGRATAAGFRETILLEVNLTGEPQKHGVAPADLPRLLDQVAALPGVEVRGLMGMAGLDADEAMARRQFAGLRLLAEQERARIGLALPELSMGMSDDFEAAIAEGATIVRIGGAIFAPRDS